MAVKICRLFVHPKTFGTADLIVNPKDFPNTKLGDIVEIYHQEEEFSRLLLQITTFKEDFQGKDTISIEQSIAATFQLRTYSDVCVNKVDPYAVSLDSVEVLFKDQYLGRSEMWRLKKTLVNSCSYLNKKIEFCGGTARVQVYEMWTQGERVACGVITEDTKIVFRSSTAMVYLFIQMSSEMWEFDIHGDLYFEKAVNGFLSDLFHKWKKYGSNHEVTIVLFSRAFYKASNLEEFPDYMRECLQKDHRGQFYEDFYRVVVQNERYDDWMGTLVLLRSLFSDYRRMILEYHKTPGYKVPTAYLSTAARGNFLEVLNISLNVFEKHYLERSLDRTGQLTVVISPGVGVYEVDRELANVTKQRIIDNGVGSDLVCVGEQPLHAVPLFKFHNKDSLITRDDYSMPHWINLSFYSSEKKLAYSKFIPRIKLPPCRSKGSSTQNTVVFATKPKLPTDCNAEDPTIIGATIPTLNIDYDGYDAEVFVLPPTHSASVQKTFGRTKKLSLSHDNKLVKWKMSDPDIYRSQLSSSVTSPPMITRSTSIAISTAHSHSLINFPVPSSSLILPLDLEKSKPTAEFFMEDELSPPSQPAISSASSSMSSSAPYMLQTTPLQSSVIQSTNMPQMYPGRALINPFDPSHVTIKMTSNRRRWTHMFPKGPTGVVIQQHHYQVSSMENADVDKKSEVYDSDLGNGSDDSPLARSPSSADSKSRMCLRSYAMFGSPDSNLHMSSKRTQALLWGVTGEQEWTPALTTGVDWKSLTIPACLPVTTDYFPDELCLKTDYVFSDYNLLPDDLNADYAQKRAIYRKPLTTKEVFNELISQRLAQGFQIVINSESGMNSCGASSIVIPKASPGVHPIVEYRLSIGRIFHKVCLYGSEIRVTRYKPRHPYPPFVIHYRYRFQAPDHSTYGTSWVSFNAEKLENYNWNYLDHYICTRGDTDFSLTESYKFWRFRLYAVPANQSSTRKIVEGNSNCDIYTPLTAEEHTILIEGFLKFIESPINKIRRCNHQASHKDMTLSLSQINRRRHSTGLAFLSHSQEKHVSASRTEKPPLVRSGSKILEKQRITPATDVIMPLTFTVDADNLEACHMMDMLRTSENVSNLDIIEMMLHPHFGIEFLSKYPSLPSNTFVSYDAVRWLKANVASLFKESDAVNTLERMRNEQLICHASGDTKHPFILGFYLYFIQKRNDNQKPLYKDKNDHTDPINDLITFENEWAEIEVIHIPPFDPPVPLFFLDEHIETNFSRYSHFNNWPVPLYKQRHLELDVSNKSDRIEWGHARYHSEYKVDCAFELVIEWVAASGSIVSDLIFSLVRKSQTYNLQLVPVPSDPHALPYALKSDPLRGPVFVPLDIECFMGNKSYLFEEFPEESWCQRLLLFQEAIALKFGFLACTIDKDSNHHNQYVHLTGNVFLLIPSPICEQDTHNMLHTKSASLHVKGAKNRLITDNEIAKSPHQEYISRHVTDMRNDNVKLDNRIGYLWSWNHMVGRRWKCSNIATGDEQFQDKLLHDFRQFCANNNNRLKIFWDSCIVQKTNKQLNMGSTGN